MANPISVGFKHISAGVKGFFVRDASGTERSAFDTDGYLYQIGTKVTSNATILNGLSAEYANRAVATRTGADAANKICLVNGLTVITGGTGIADMTLAAPTEGARAVIRIGSLSSGNVVVTTAAGVTLNGTNNTATFNAVDEALVLIYKAANTWEVELNVGAVALSTVA